MRTVLVTGGNGFIGRHVTEELVGRHLRVNILDTRYRQPEQHAQIILGDMRDATSVTEAMAHVDGAIHLGGVLGTQETIGNPRPAAETNILGGLNVLEAAAQYNTPLVNIAVGNWWMNNTYSITKNTIERFAIMLNSYRGTKITTLRAMNAYGERQVAAAPYGPSKVRKIMPSFICRALAGEPIEIYGDGEQIMDMIYVKDLARALVDALVKTDEVGAVTDVLEAGSGRPTTVNEIASIVVREVANQTGKDPVLVNHLPMRPGEDERSVVLANPGTLAAIGTDHTAFVPLEEGVQKTVAYFKRELSL